MSALRLHRCPSLAQAVRPLSEQLLTELHEQFVGLVKTTRFPRPRRDHADPSRRRCGGGWRIVRKKIGGD